MDWTNIIIAAIGLIGGAVTSYIALLSKSKESETEHDEFTYKHLRAENDRLYKKVEELQQLLNIRDDMILQLKQTFETRLEQLKETLELASQQWKIEEANLKLQINELENQLENN
ncbi:MAG: hypothetical protein ACPGFK_00675 [Flavobacteriaceae bacterium]